jgi:uncharacterized Zn finger protein
MISPVENTTENTTENTRCDQCGGDTEFELEVPPLGEEPGLRMCRCLNCGRSVWQHIYNVPSPSSS